MKLWLERAKDWFWIHEYQFAVAVALVVVAGLSFELGLIRGSKWQVEPVIIEKPAPVATCEASSGSPPGAPNLTQEKGITQAGVKDQVQNCQLVGSKNSNKVHLATCSWAKRIKPENQVCFQSIEDATSKGRIADKCIK